VEEQELKVEKITQGIFYTGVSEIKESVPVKGKRPVKPGCSKQDITDTFRKETYTPSGAYYSEKQRREQENEK